MRISAKDAAARYGGTCVKFEELRSRQQDQQPVEDGGGDEKSEEVSDRTCEGQIKNREKGRTELWALHLIDPANALNDALRLSLDEDEFSSACSSSWKT